jgi:hypothetical protein
MEHGAEIVFGTIRRKRRHVLTKVVNREAHALMSHIGPDATAEMLDRMGLLLSHIADTITDEGDRAVLNSTNDADRIRALAEEWRHRRYEMHDSADVHGYVDRLELALHAISGHGNITGESARAIAAEALGEPKRQDN